MGDQNNFIMQNPNAHNQYNNFGDTSNSNIIRANFNNSNNVYQGRVNDTYNQNNRGALQMNSSVSNNFNFITNTYDSHNTNNVVGVNYNNQMPQNNKYGKDNKKNSVRGGARSRSKKNKELENLEFSSDQDNSPN